MKRLFLLFHILVSQITFNLHAQGVQRIDLTDAVAQEQIEVVNRDLTLIREDGYAAIRLSKALGEGVAWIKDVAFETGTVEFDVRGEDLKQHSFVGIAFHGQNDSTYDAVYLRPFHFHALDSVSQHRMIQFISLPEFTWRKLRAEYPGRFEGRIQFPPDPNAWVHVRLDVTASSISVYINKSIAPSLVVQPVRSLPSGRIGFYVADTSGGDFSNLSVRHER